MTNPGVAEFDATVVKFMIDSHNVELGNTTARKIHGTGRSRQPGRRGRRPWGMAMDPQDRRAQLEARNAAMRQQVDSLLAGLNRQTAALHSAQAQAAAVTSQVTSADGLVTVTVNAGGVLTDAHFAPSAFDRSTPEKLARSVVAVAQQAAAGARQQVEGLLAPVRGDLPDLPDVFAGAPSLSESLAAVLPGPAAASPRGPSAAGEDEDFSTRSVLR